MSLPCEHVTRLPVSEHPGTTVDPHSAASDWFRLFSSAVQSKDTQSIKCLFLDDSFWRDMLALTSDFRTIHGASNIKALLDEALPRVELSALKMAEEPYRQPTLSTSIPGVTLLQICFDFETKIGKGSGICRLSLTPNGGPWKIYTMYTCLDALKDFPEKVGPNRDANYHKDGSWEEKRQREKEFIDRQPTVIVIGAGHVGLEVAACLKHLGVSVLVVEQRSRVGNNWRDRYKNLSLHDPVWYNTTPYLTYPSSWPVYAPARKVADWLENYAHVLELDVWTSAKATQAKWNDKTKSWHVEIVRQGKGTTRFDVKHLVFATGLGGGVPAVPDIPGKDSFKGTILHSTQFTSAKEYTGKKAVVVGCGASGHDIAQDFLNHKVDVTMYQRSPSYVISIASINALLGGLYNEVIPTDFADHMMESTPLAVSKFVFQGVTSHLAGTVDKDLLGGLGKVGYKISFGIEDTGVVPLVFQKGGGYYIDTGTSKHLINGDIKLKSGSSIERCTEKGLKFADGSELEADVIVFATGYGDPRGAAKDVLEPEVQSKLTPVWGYDKEGEVMGAWRRLAQPGLWWGIGNFAKARFHSRHLALQIKAIEEGLMPL